MAIENARLYRASVHATQLRDQVLGVVAHDLRNPLSTILMQASALKRQGPEPERRSLKPVEVIQRAAAHEPPDSGSPGCRTHGGRTVDHRASATICRWVDCRGGGYAETARTSSSLEFEWKCRPDVPEVWGDRDRLLQVFENLIGNAIKFTQAAAVSRRARHRKMTMSSSGLRIRAVGSRPRTCPLCSTDFGRQPGRGVRPPGSDSQSSRHHRGSRRTMVESTAGLRKYFFLTVPKAVAVPESLADSQQSDRAA